MLAGTLIFSSQIQSPPWCHWESRRRLKRDRDLRGRWYDTHGNRWTHNDPPCKHQGICVHLTIIRKLIYYWWVSSRLEETTANNLNKANMIIFFAYFLSLHLSLRLCVGLTIYSEWERNSVNNLMSVSGSRGIYTWKTTGYLDTSWCKAIIIVQRKMGYSQD